MSVAIPIPLLQNLPDVNVTPAVGVDENALCWDNDTAKFVLRATNGYDHGLLNGTSLGDDDHTQYALLAGRAGGQTIYGGTAANDDITIHGTAHATRTTSYVLLQPTAGNVGIGIADPEAKVHILGNLVVATAGSALGTIRGANAARGDGGAIQTSTSNTAAEKWVALGKAASSTGAFTAVMTVMADGTGNVGIGDTAPAEKLDVTGNINATGVYKVDDVQVLSNRVIDARADDVANSGDATTDGLIDALRDAMIAHGLIAAA